VVEITRFDADGQEEGGRNRVRIARIDSQPPTIELDAKIRVQCAAVLECRLAARNELVMLSLLLLDGCPIARGICDGDTLPERTQFGIDRRDLVRDAVTVRAKLPGSRTQLRQFDAKLATAAWLDRPRHATSLPAACCVPGTPRAPGPARRRGR